MISPSTFSDDNLSNIDTLKQSALPAQLTDSKGLSLEKVLGQNPAYRSSDIRKTAPRRGGFSFKYRYLLCKGVNRKHLT